MATGSEIFYRFTPPVKVLPVIIGGVVVGQANLGQIKINKTMNSIMKSGKHSINREEQ